MDSPSRMSAVYRTQSDPHIQTAAQKSVPSTVAERGQMGGLVDWECAAGHNLLDLSLFQGANLGYEMVLEQGETVAGKLEEA